MIFLVAVSHNSNNLLFSAAAGWTPPLHTDGSFGLANAAHPPNPTSQSAVAEAPEEAIPRAGSGSGPSGPMVSAVSAAVSLSVPRDRLQPTDPFCPIHRILLEGLGGGTQTPLSAQIKKPTTVGRQPASFTKPTHPFDSENPPSVVGPACPLSILYMSMYDLPEVHHAKQCNK